MKPRGLFLLGLAFGLALGPACGMQHEPPFAGARQPDVAPWQDLGPLLFCDGPYRLSPSQSAGWCEEGTLSSCHDDQDCRSRERCTCGGCQVVLCDSNEECDPNEVCSFADRRCDRPCSSSHDCAAGEFCVPGQNICRGHCGRDEECQTGERCDQGECVASPCNRDLDCAAAHCRLQRRSARLAEPMPLATSEGTVLWLERGPESARSIWRAVPNDATGQRFHFQPSQAVLEGFGAPALLSWENRYLGAFEREGRIWRATSDDGIHFAVDPTPLVTGSSPSLIRFHETLLLFYSTAETLAMARSPDGRHFVVSAPPLPPSAFSDPILWRDVDTLVSPFAVAATAPDGQPVLRLFLAARGRESLPSQEFGRAVEETPNFSIAEAASLDGIHFVPWPYNPVFDRVTNFLTHGTERDPAILPLAGGKTLLYYRGGTSDRPLELRVAQNPVSQDP